MKRAPFFFIASIGFATSPITSLYAADNAIEVVITAGRKAQTIDETLAPVTVITRQDIERSQASTLQEILQKTPSVNIINNGGAGKVTSLFLRGTESDHVLVLIDGVKAGSATSGGTALQYLPTENIERIEIVRGSQSSLYGSEAIGGVIHIITRRGGKGFQPSLAISAGSHNSGKVNANLSGGNNQTWYNVNLVKERTAGFDSCVKSACGTDEPDRDGFDRESFSLRAGHRFANGAKAEVATMDSSGQNDFDGYTNNNQYRQQSIAGNIVTPLSANTSLSARLGQFKDESTYYINETFSSEFNTKRTVTTLQTDTNFRNGAFTIGIDQQKEQVDSNKKYVNSHNNAEVKQISNRGIFANTQYNLGNNRLGISIRQDKPEQAGAKTTGNIALSHRFANGIKLTASHGTAFKAPTFNDLYWPGSGNSDLKPETSRNSEMSISRMYASSHWEVNLFNNKIDSLINWAPDNKGNWRPTNIDKAQIQGIELIAGKQWGNWSISSNVTLQNPKNTSDGANKDKQLIRRSKQILNVNLDRQIGKVGLGATLHAESKRYDNSDNTDERKLAGFATLDLRGQYQMNKDWSLGVKIGNVLDKNYQTAYGYNQDGANGLVTLTYSPQ